MIGVKENDYFLAARVAGTPTIQILIRHVLPNIMAPLIIVFSINIGGVIIAEASLSFLGFGLPPRFPAGAACSVEKDENTWNRLPGWRSGRGFALTIVVYALNMVGDAMRESLLDPRLRGGAGQLRRQETQTRIPLQTDQPFQWVSG